MCIWLWGSWNVGYGALLQESEVLGGQAVLNSDSLRGPVASTYTLSGELTLFVCDSICLCLCACVCGCLGWTLQGVESPRAAVTRPL